MSACDTHLGVSTNVGTPSPGMCRWSTARRCTDEGDVYSFGVVLLKLVLVMRRQPAWLSGMTDKLKLLSDDDANSKYEGGGKMDLVGWVKRHVMEDEAR